MIVHHSLEGTGIKNAVVTTGSFDGVHSGHRVILKRINQIAQREGGESVLITFYPHPRKILYPDTEGKDLKMINSQEEKIYLLQQTRIDHLIILPFNLEFSKLSSVDFIRQILVGSLHTREVVVGFNHFFGHNRQGDIDLLRALGKYYHFGVEEIPEQDIQNETVSSTKIRKALIDGNIQRANAYLDHPYMMLGSLRPTKEESLFRGFVECVLPEADKLIPPPGAYATSLIHHNHRDKALVHIIQEDNGRRIFCRTTNANEINGSKLHIEFHKALWLQNGELLNNLGFDHLDDLKRIDELIY